MGIFDRGKKMGDRPFVALDVGTEVVKVLICTLEKGNVNVVGVAKTQQSFAAMKGGVISNLRSVSEVCAQTLQRAQENIPTAKPKKVIIGIAGELVKGVMVEASYDREIPEEVITTEELLGVIEKAKEDANEESKRIYAQDKQTQIIEVGAVVADTIIDGFRVEDPVGLQGKKVCAKVFYTFAPRLHVGYLTSLANALKLELSAILPEPFAIVKAIKGSAEESFQGIVIDVGGGTTDIAIVKKGVLVGTEMISFGGRVFTKRIAQDLMINHEQAEKLKIRYSTRELIQSKIPEIKAAIKKDIPLWMDTVELALEEYSEEVKTFPDKIMLCGGGSLLPEIKTALVEFPWTKRLPFNRAPSISFLTPENLLGVTDKTLSLTKTEDVAPVAIARFGLDVSSISEK